MLPVEGKRPVFARRLLQFPPRNTRWCAKTRTNCRHTFRASPFTGLKCVGEEKHQRQKKPWIHCSTTVQKNLKGTCTRTSCEYWHLPECHFYKRKTGCMAGDKCLFPYYKVDEQPNKKPKKSYFPKRRESDDKNAVAIVKSLS